MRRLISSIIFSLAVICSISAQITIRVVEKESHDPVESAYAAVLTGDSSMVCYGYTDEKGNCVLDIDLKAISPEHTLNVSCLGYSRLSLPMIQVSNGMHIELAHGAFHIKEVKVSAERIKLDGDTIEYSVRGFSQPSDRSIADVLAKMPGVEVKSNGSIYFNGKPINKFYIENMDLMGSKYRLASQNLDFRKVKSVQVLQNHQKIAALRGKSFSENAAINLVLEDEAKNIPIGQGEVGSGYSDNSKDAMLVNARLMYMLFSKRHQNLSILKAGNIGKNLYSEMQPLLMDEEELSVASSANYVNPVSIAHLDIGEERQNFGRSALAATNNLNKLKEQTFFRTQVGYYYDKTLRENHIEKQYLLSDGSRTDIVEVMENTSEKNRVDLSLCYEQNEERLYVMDKLTGTLLLDRNKGKYIGRNDAGELYTRPDNRYLYNQFRFTKPTRKIGMLSASSDIAYDCKPQKLLLINGKMEKLKSDRLALANKSEILKKYRDLTVTHRIGWNVNRNAIESFLDETKNIPHQSLLFSDLYYRGNASYKTDKTTFSGTVNLHWLNREAKTPETVFADSRAAVDGHLSLRYVMSPKSNLTIYYNIDNMSQDIAENPQGILYTDYRSAVSNELYGNLDRRQTLGVRLYYSDPIKGTFFSLGLNGYDGTVSTLGEYSFRDGVYYSERHYSPTGIHGISGTVRYNQALPFWKSTLSASGSYTRTAGGQYFQDDIVGYTSERSSITLSWSGRPSRWLAIDGEYSRYDSSIKSEGRTRRNNSDYRLTLSGIFSKKFDVSANMQYSVLGNDNKGVFLSDIIARYQFKKMSLEMILNNITDQKQYIREEITNIMQSRTIYTLRPREYMIKVSWVM